jgi:hypothetical protein
MAHEGGRRSHKHGFAGDASHDAHIRAPGDSVGDTHLGNAMKHIAEQKTAEHHMVGQHKVEGGFDGEHNVPDPHYKGD